MHVLVNQADVELGLEALNEQYSRVYQALPLVYRHLSNNVTTPLLLEICLKRDGVTLPMDWCRRAATVVSLKHQLPIPQALALRDSEFFAFILICKLLGW